MKNIRENYPALEKRTYFNSPSCGLFSKQVVAYRRSIDEEHLQNPHSFRAGVYNTIKEIKRSIATAFGAETERTALIPSCSYGINLVLEALADGQKVMHLKNDYPSIIWPFRSRNYHCITVDNEDYSEEELIKNIKAHQIKILAVSAVQYSNGEIIAAQTFRAIKKQFPEILILVDGTQFLGTAAFNFRESGIDLFAASTFKWLCAGFGNGVMFMSEQLEEKLNSKARGYNTYKNPRKEGSPTLGEFFEPGHQDLLVFKTLEFQVKWHSEIGFENIQAQIKEVKMYLREKIKDETPYKIITSVNPYLASGILSVDAPKELVKYLNANNIVCSFNRGLRLGVHFYNNLEDVDELIKKIKEFESLN